MTAQRKFIADRRYVHVDGSLYDIEDADKGGLATTPVFKTAITLGIFADAAFTLTQPASVRAVVFVAGLGYAGLVAWSSVAKFRTLVYRTTDPWAPYVIDKSGQGWSNDAAATQLRARYQRITAKNFSTAFVKATLGTVAGFALGLPEAGIALAAVGAGSDIITAAWSIHAEAMLTRGKWCVLKHRPRLRLRPVPANVPRG